MDATPTYAFPFPEDTDAPDGPAQLEALALAVEAKIAAMIATTDLPLLPRGRKMRVQLSTSSDIGTSETITHRANVTLEANRCYRVTLSTPVLDNQATAGQTAIVTLRYVAGVGPVTSTGTLIAKATNNVPPGTGSTTAGTAAETVTLVGLINNVAAGTYDVGVGLAALSASSNVRFLVAGTVGPDFSPYLLVEDIGPNL